MNTYRTLWLGLCVPLVAVGAAVAPVRSPVPVALLFVIFGGVGALLTMSSVDGFWEHAPSGPLLLATGGGFVAGISVGAFIGFASVLGTGVFMLAAAVVAGSPYAVTACSRWIRSVRHSTAYLAAEPGAAARSLVAVGPGTARPQ